jgi:hypothetical protein
MRRSLKHLLVITTTAFVGLVIVVFVLFAWSVHADQQRFRAAKNDCERGCIQDSGGLDECRKMCVSHPNRYP